MSLRKVFCRIVDIIRVQCFIIVMLIVVVAVIFYAVYVASGAIRGASEAMRDASEVLRVASQTFTASHLRAAYRAAVVDAIVAEPGEISDRLTPVRHGWNGTHWTTIERENHVLTVTWTPRRDDYEGNLGSSKKLERDVWITLVPEVREYCSQLSVEDDLDLLRLEQLLGLPPAGGKTTFVEMWVRPRDLFRPCPDPEIDDRRCNLNFPARTDQRHRDWFNRSRETSYDGARIFPWTRLGYTYDWGNPSREVGLSEYVISKDAEVVVRSVTTTSAYCAG